MNHWLIGVRSSERDAKGEPRFIQQLQTKLNEAHHSLKDTLVRHVTDPAAIDELRLRHGEGYVEFFYVDDAILKASQKAKVRLHPLELVFGPTVHAEVYAGVRLPSEFWPDAEASRKPAKKRRRRAQQLDKR